MKLALYLLIIMIGVVNISTENQNTSEGLNDILDKLIRQAENGNNGLVVDKVEKKDNDSKVIYLKPNDSINHRSAFERSTNDIKKLIHEDPDNNFSEEIIVEMKEVDNEGMGNANDQENMKKIAEPVASLYDQIENNNMPGKDVETYFEEVKEEPIIEEVLLEESINDDNRKNIVHVLKDMFELPKEPLIKNKHLNENGKHQKTKPKNIDPVSKLSLRTFFPNVDAGKVIPAFTENEQPSPMRSFYPLNYPVEDPVQSILRQQFLAQMLHNKATQTPNYFQYFMPNIVTPPPSVRTVIHHNAYPSADPYYWQTEPQCCLT